MTDDPNDPSTMSDLDGADDFAAGDALGGDDASFDDFDDAEFDFDGAAGKNTLKDLWENNPLVKVGVIMAAFMFIVGGVILFGGGAERAPPSVTAGASELKQAPGTEEVSPLMAKALEETNVREAERAELTGQSALPVPITPPSQSVALQGDPAQAEDPLARWRRIQEERQRAPVADVQEAPAVDPHAGAVDALAQAMARQMGSVLENQVMGKIYHTKVTDYEAWLAARRPPQGTGADAPATVEEEIVLDIIAPAGSIAYAQLLLEANTDAPGPVLAQIVTGPLAGSRMIGTFTTMERYLVLSFNTIVVDGIAYTADAVAVDPKTANTGMITEINRRYLQRIVLPAAASFIEGMGEAIADRGTTNVTVSGDMVIEESRSLNTREEIFKGIEKGAATASRLIEREASTIRPLLRVAAGTPMGVLFLDPVTKNSMTQGQRY